MVQSAGYMRRAGAGRYGGKEKLRRQTEEAANRMNEEVRRTGKARSKKEKLRNGPDTGKRKANRNLGRMRRDGCRRGHARHGEWSRRDASDIDGSSREAERSGSE